MQVLELICNDFLIGVLAGLFGEDESCLDDLNYEIDPVRNPQGLFDSLLIEAWKLILFEVLEEILDGPAKGILVSLAEEWSLIFDFDVSQILLVVLLVDFSDLFDSFGEISGPFSDFGVSDDIGFYKQNG